MRFETASTQEGDAQPLCIYMAGNKYTSDAAELFANSNRYACCNGTGRFKKIGGIFARNSA